MSSRTEQLSSQREKGPHMLNLGSQLSDLLSDIVLTPVDIVDVEQVASHFTRVRLQGDAILRSRWTPGDKLQLRVRRGSVDLRTYTPFEWDTQQGTTDLIAFNHGPGPGVRWFLDAVSGAVCEIFGPSRSINLSDPAGEVMFIGDETSIALALALRDINPTARYLFEAANPDTLHSALAAFGFLGDFEIVPKSEDRRVLLHCARAAGEECGGDLDLVVSGDAATVDAVRRAARSWSPSAPRVRARAYWAKGRTGLS
jgi:NADPH-dependent ferric siderophore reductase